jgi:ribose-phosphate pyrophosphokinase
MYGVTLKNAKGYVVPVKHSTFPAGEVYVKISNDEMVTPEQMTVVLSSADAEDILRAIMLSSALETYEVREVVLEVAYMPYGRQDRVCSRGESDSLLAFMRILHTAFDRVVTIDLHNPESESVKWMITDGLLINKKPFNAFERVISLRKQELTLFPSIITEQIVAPDRGAVKRASQFAEDWDSEKPVVILDKYRKPDGMMHNLENPHKLAEASYITIVDDICDGGATFLSAAKVLKEVNPSAELYLVVTHGIFSAGTEKLLDMFTDIYVENTPFNLNHILGGDDGKL